MDGVEIISSSAIESSLANSDRQYLTGNLSRPQELDHLFDDELEVGISDYPEKKADAAHFHPTAREYQYVIAGSLKIMDLRDDSVVEISAGDFYAIERGTPYAQVVAAGTRVFFLKSPGVNDKTLVELTDAQAAWMERTLSEEPS